MGAGVVRAVFQRVFVRGSEGSRAPPGTHLWLASLAWLRPALAACLPHRQGRFALLRKGIPRAAPRSSGLGIPPLTAGPLATVWSRCAGIWRCPTRKRAGAEGGGCCGAVMAPQEGTEVLPGSRSAGASESATARPAWGPEGETPARWSLLGVPGGRSPGRPRCILRTHHGVHCRPGPRSRPAGVSGATKSPRHCVLPGAATGGRAHLGVKGGVSLDSGNGRSTCRS